MTGDSDNFLWSPSATLRKFTNHDAAFARFILGHHPSGDELIRECVPYETIHVEGNLLTTAGLTLITGLMIGNVFNTLDATRVRLGVGSSSTAATTADASLGASQQYDVMDAPYPTASAGVLTFQSSFQNSEANFAWQCWGLDAGTAPVASGTTPATLVNRKVTSLGTKSSGIWVLTVTVTLT